jgi:hypothetical protein
MHGHCKMSSTLRSPTSLDNAAKLKAPNRERELNFSRSQEECRGAH